MTTKDFLMGAARLALAFFIALGGLVAAIAIYAHLKDTREREAARPYEDVRDWQTDLRDRLGLDVHAKTKLVSGRLLVSIDVAGHPKYLDDQRNQTGSLNFEFLDKDGFKLSSHSVEISEFSTIVAKSGESTGLRHQYEEYLDLDRYRQFSRLQVGWNLVTQPPTVAESKPLLDHCAPSLSKAERLKRLAQHGTVRESGVGEFTAGDHSVTLLPYDGAILSCR